jgi:hypothetical protein
VGAPAGLVVEDSRNDGNSAKRISVGRGKSPVCRNELPV